MDFCFYFVTQYHANAFPQSSLLGWAVWCIFKLRSVLYLEHDGVFTCGNLPHSISCIQFSCQYHLLSFKKQTETKYHWSVVSITRNARFGYNCKQNWACKRNQTFCHLFVSTIKTKAIYQQIQLGNVAKKKPSLSRVITSQYYWRVSMGIPLLFLKLREIVFCSDVSDRGLSQPFRVRRESHLIWINS